MADPAKPAIPARKTDRGAAYYHYMMAHMYEEQVAVYGRSDLANKAIEEYRQAIEADPTSEYLTSGLAELYFRTGRIRDAVLEAQDVLKRDPNNLESHKLLGRIYLHSLGDVQGGSGSKDVLKRAIEQYEQIVRIEPDSVEDHLLLGRLYKVNNDLLKAEGEFKTAVQLDPDSEEAVTMLAYLYNGYFKAAGHPMFANMVSMKDSTAWFSYMTYLETFSYGHLGRGSALSFLISLITLAVAFIYIRILFRSGESAS